MRPPPSASGCSGSSVSSEADPEGSVARLNDTVEAALIEYADLLSILTDDPYKPRSYEKAYGI